MNRAAPGIHSGFRFTGLILASSHYCLILHPPTRFISMGFCSSIFPRSAQRFAFLAFILSSTQISLWSQRLSILPPALITQTTCLLRGLYRILLSLTLQKDIPL